MIYIYIYILCIYKLYMYIGFILVMFLSSRRSRSWPKDIVAKLSRTACLMFGGCFNLPLGSTQSARKTRARHQLQKGTQKGSMIFIPCSVWVPEPPELSPLLLWNFSNSFTWNSKSLKTAPTLNPDNCSSQVLHKQLFLPVSIPELPTTLKKMHIIWWWTQQKNLGMDCERRNTLVISGKRKMILKQPWQILMYNPYVYEMCVFLFEPRYSKDCSNSQPANSKVASQLQIPTGSHQLCALWVLPPLPHWLPCRPARTMERLPPTRMFGSHRPSTAPAAPPPKATGTAPGSSWRRSARHWHRPAAAAVLPTRLPPPHRQRRQSARGFGLATCRSLRLAKKMSPGWPSVPAIGPITGHHLIMQHRPSAQYLFVAEVISLTRSGSLSWSSWAIWIEWEAQQSAGIWRDKNDTVPSSSPTGACKQVGPLPLDRNASAVLKSGEAALYLNSKFKHPSPTCRACRPTLFEPPGSTRVCLPPRWKYLHAQSCSPTAWA